MRRFYRLKDTIKNNLKTFKSPQRSPRKKLQRGFFHHYCVGFVADKI